MKIIGFLFWIVIVLAILVFILGQLGVLKGKAPTNIGVNEGRLKPPSKSPNSASSQADLYPDHAQKDYAAVDPIKFTGDADSAMENLAKILEKRERTIVIRRDPGYIYAQCSTKLLKYTDDLEFLMDKPAGVIHVRSASRLGRKDFGVNRARVEAIRAEFNR